MNNHKQSQQHVIKVFQVILAIFTVLMLTMLYTLVPEKDFTEPLLGKLIYNMIPEAIVLLIAIPVFYYLVYKNGLSPEHEINKLSEQIDQLTSTLKNRENLQVPLPQKTLDNILERSFIESEKLSNNRVKQENKDILIVIDYQNDFIDGSLRFDGAIKILTPLNKAIKKAEQKEMLVIFIRDWHPENHSSFTKHGGVWPTHCVRNTKGAELHKDLYIPRNSITIDFGTDTHSRGFSPYENLALGQLIENPNINNVYIAGVALEYCVLATCLETVKRDRKTTILKSAVASIDSSSEEAKKAWKRLREIGVIQKNTI